MAEKYTDRVKEYCASSGIAIPAGFNRQPAGRYAIIDLEATPPKLVARTWFNREDVVYYLQHLSAGNRVKILDFKERQELVLESSNILKPGTSF